MPKDSPPNALTRQVRAREERPPQVVSRITRGGSGSSSRDSVPSNSDVLSPRLLLRGLWQHLITALVLGTVVGGAGAAAAWFLTPAPYEAKALIQVESMAPKLVFDTAENKRSDVHFVRTQMTLMTSEVVLRKVLAAPEVAELDLFKGMKSPLAYLKKNLRVRTPMSPVIVELTLTGEDPRGLATVVNHVQQTYFEEIVNVERNSRVHRLQDLQRILEEKAETIRSKRDVMKKMTEVVGSSADPEVAGVQHKNTLDMMNAMRTQWMNKRFELTREQLTLAAMQGDLKLSRHGVPDELLDAYVSEDPEVVKLETQLATKQSLISDYEKVMTNKDDARIRELRTQVAGLRRSLRETQTRIRPRVESKLQQELQAKQSLTVHEREFRVKLLTQEEAKLRSEFELLQKEAARLGATSFELEDLRDEIDSVDRIGERIQSEIHALQVELKRPPAWPACSRRSLRPNVIRSGATWRRPGAGSGGLHWSVS